MTEEERKLTIEYLEEMKEKYIEGEGYERHPLPEWYALDKAIEALEQDSIFDKIKAEIEALPKTYPFVNHFDMYVKVSDVTKIIDKYKADYYDGFTSYSQSQIDEAEEVKAIPLEEVKQTKEEISDWDVNKAMDGCSEPFRLGVARGLDIASEILDKLIKKQRENTSDVELAIKVPEEIYDAVMHKNSKHLELDAFYVIDEMGKAIANGTPLPKG